MHMIVLLACMCMLQVYMRCAERQKGESDLQELEFPLDVNCHEGWELNSGQPQEKVLLFTKHSLQSS